MLSRAIRPRVSPQAVATGVAEGAGVAVGAGVEAGIGVTVGAGVGMTVGTFVAGAGGTPVGMAGGVTAGWAAGFAGAHAAHNNNRLITPTGRKRRSPIQSPLHHTNSLAVSLAAIDKTLVSLR
jgi:hypothetical protein